MIKLDPQILTSERFAPYGDVIEAAPMQTAAMNEARFERFDDLCGLDVGDGRIAISIARCRVATSMPYRVDMVERHPLGSQAFVPLQRCRMLLLVAPPGESVEASELRAFVSNGRQGINYRRGTWHMPLIAFDEGNEFLIVDRAMGEPNCDMHDLAEPVLLNEF
ncbi:MAG: ureidoglycolate lyase [Woeseiaceae bacterium]